MYQVAVENAFDFRSAEYVGLFHSSDATAFQHPVWLSALYARLLDPNGAEPLIVTARDESGTLAMVLPLVRRRYGGLRVIEFADLRVSDYASVVAASEAFAAIAADRAVRREVARLLGPHDLVRINKLASGGLPLEALLGGRPPRSMGMNAYATSLDGDYEAWRQGRLAPSYRKELDKKLRQLHRRGKVRFAEATAGDEIDAVLQATRAFRRERFAEAGGELFQVPAYYSFYASVAAEIGARLARTYGLWVDEQPIAGVLGLSHRGRFLVIVSGFDQAEFKNQSIGSLMFQEVARDCIARGDSLLDFTIGDEAYKLTFGAEPTEMWRLSRAASPLGFAADTLVERLPAAKALARRLFHRQGRARRPRPPSPPAGSAVPGKPAEAR